jgi:1-acyl-sn-glycerol-3-phosphate acyltransferase
MSFLRALLRVVGLVGFTLALVMAFAVARPLRIKGWRSLPRLWHRTAARMIGLRIRVRGTLRRESPVLYVANHCSYLDIVALGAALRGSFVAKKDIESWPAFGVLARCQNTIFIERNPRLARLHQDEIARRLSAGDNLILFPEGTSTDGNRVLPFKSTLFSVAQAYRGEKPLFVQPLTLAYTRLNGLPMGRVQRPLATWFGDMALGPHLWHLLKQGRVTVEIIAHPPVADDAYPSRKELSRHCERVVRAGLQEALTGRQPDTAPDALIVPSVPPETV